MLRIEAGEELPKLGVRVDVDAVGDDPVLAAVEAPAGVMPVVLGGGWPGILLHEAIGHGLEADFNRKETSAFSHLLDKRVASDVCTIVDDGTLPGRRGSLNMDDEGNPTQCTTLIEDGILVGYMQDRQNARLMNMKPTGNGRRQGYAHVPMPRMTNTYMLAGDDDPEDNPADLHPLRDSVQQKPDDVRDAAGERRLNDDGVGSRVCNALGERRLKNDRVVRLLERRRRAQYAGDAVELYADHDLLRDRFTYQGCARNVHRAIELAADRTVHACLDAN